MATYLGFHTPQLGKRLTLDSITEGSVLGFDDRRDAIRMAARLVEHKRAVHRWPSMHPSATPFPNPPTIEPNAQMQPAA